MGNKKIYRNYHTHTVRCKHASDRDEDYVLHALERGYDTLGFSDHAPWPYAGGTESVCRMPVDLLEDYVSSVRRLQAEYRGRLKILLGLECEYYPQYYDWLRQKRDEYQMDYLILGNHFLRDDEQDCHFSHVRTPDLLLQYADMAIAGMKTGLFTYLAHPDVVLASYPEFDKTCEEMSRMICQASNEMHFPLEYNLQGKLYQDRKVYDGLEYPCLEFWKIAGAMGCEAIVGVDAHAAASLDRTDRIDEGWRILDSYGCRMTDRIHLISG